MEKTKVLFISQEIVPYTPENEVSAIVRNLPSYIQDSGNEARLFMPRYGYVNERRFQLHEVIRLSGMNVVIDETDHPVQIKVASLPQAKMQVYFIDNEEYFKRKSLFHEEETQVFFPDNDERMIFFSKAVLETIKKLGWTPDIIHCHGWFTSLIPMYIKTMYNDDPVFMNSKVVYSVYNDQFTGKINEQFFQKAVTDEETKKILANYTSPVWEEFIALGSKHSDAVLLNNITDAKVKKLVEKNNKTTEAIQDTNLDIIGSFYDEVLELDSVSI